MTRPLTAALALAALLTSPAAAAPKLVRTWSGYAKSADIVRWSGDSKRVLTVGDGNVVQLWDVHTGHRLLRLVIPGSPRLAEAAFDEAGTRFLTVGEGAKGFAVWDAGTGRQLMKADGAESPLGAARFLPGKDAVVSAEPRALRVWGLSDGKLRAAYVRGDAQAAGLGVSSGGGYVHVLDVAGRYEVFDLQQGVKTGEWHAQVRGVSAADVSLSPAQTLAVATLTTSKRPSGGESYAVLLDGHDGHTLATWKDAPASCADLSPDDAARALTGAPDGMVTLRTVATGKVQTRWKAHEGKVTSVFFAPSGRSAVTASSDKTVKLWNLPSSPRTP